MGPRGAGRIRGDDYVGAPVNLAARLCDRADADQILAAEAGLVVPDSVVRGRAAQIRLPGFSEKVTVVALATRPRGRRVLPLPRLVRGEEPSPAVGGSELDTPVEISEGEAGS